MTRPREILLFLLASLVLSFAVFGDAMLGRSITAPVDIAPALWAQYRFVDPQSNGIPENHHIVDQLAYDLPLQWSVYHAYRRGEVPWWDPYTFGGRPLLADSHVSGMDPVRMLIYLTVPDFVLAYNWTLIAHHLILGLGLFVFLRHLGASPLVAGMLALAGQFGGAFVLFIGHPWITASFCWYPWLWWAWSAGWQKPARWCAPLSAITFACVVYSGNLQSHVYLALFALCFVLGSAGRDLARLKRAVGMVTVTSVVGLLLSAPALGPTLELFRENVRAVSEVPNRGDGLLLLSAVWPWSFGTFRTITRENMGFYFYLGPIVTLLAIYGVRARPGATPAQATARRIALWILVLLIVLLCTPMLRILYRRVAGLGALALLVLSVNGLARLRDMAAGAEKKLSRILVAAIILIVAGTLTAVHVLYPRFRGKIEEMMQGRMQEDIYDGRSEALRRFQVDNYPREVGFGNPEVAAALAALVLAAAAARAGRFRAWAPWLLCASLVSPALFARRFVPRQPLEKWERLLAGSPEQRAVVATVGAGRLWEDVGGTHASYSQLFPMATANWYGIHVVHGYSALQPKTQSGARASDLPKLADWRHFFAKPGAAGEMEQLNPTRSARFQWKSGKNEPVKVTPVGLNRIVLVIPSGAHGELLRTDTHFPGWTATANDQRACAIRAEGILSVISVPEGASSIVLEYRPALFTWYWGAFALGAILAGLLFLRPPGRRGLEAALG